MKWHWSKGQSNWEWHQAATGSAEVSANNQQIITIGTSATKRQDLTLVDWLFPFAHSVWLQNNRVKSKIPHWDFCLEPFCGSANLIIPCVGHQPLQIAHWLVCSKAYLSSLEGKSKVKGLEEFRAEEMGLIHQGYKYHVYIKSTTELPTCLILFKKSTI